MVDFEIYIYLERERERERERDRGGGVMVWIFNVQQHLQNNLNYIVIFITCLLYRY